MRTQYFPAREVSGDFLVVRRVDANRLLLGLGDVSGKGMPAALTMARLTAMIEISSDSIGADLGEWVSRMNRQVTRDMKAGRFVGLTFLLADAEESSIQICAAGQVPPLHFDGGPWQRFEMKTQLPLGILSTCTYTSERAPLRRGDSWLLFSDGITEARNTADEDAVRTLASLAGFSPRITHQIDSLELVEDLILAGYGVGLLPLDRATREGIVVLPLTKPELVLTAYAATRRGRSNWAPLRLVLDRLTMTVG